MNEMFIFFKIRGVLKKSNETKLYFPRKKGTMNEILIFFKIRAVLKKVTRLKLYFPRKKKEQ